MGAQYFLVFVTWVFNILLCYAVLGFNSKNSFLESGEERREETCEKNKRLGGGLSVDHWSLKRTSLWTVTILGIFILRLTPKHSAHPIPCGILYNRFTFKFIT